MSAWQGLVKQSILGSQRQTLQLTEFDSAVVDALATDQTANDELKFLHALALLGQYQLNGLQQARPCPDDLAEITECADETLQPCSSKTTEQLRTLLVNKDIDLLEELLQLLLRYRRHAPFELLPILLDSAVRNTKLRPLAAKTMGERGLWLCQFNDDWQALFKCESDDDVEKKWQHSSMLVRKKMLSELRQTDSDKALELLRETWLQDNAKDRLALLQLLRPELNDADKEFLQQCLNDRSQSVRSEAVQQLVLLGDVDIIETVKHVVSNCLKVEKKWRKLNLIVELPDDYDKTWNRFGLKEKEQSSTSQLIGKKASWLRQWLCLVPPIKLATVLQVDMSSLMQAIDKHGDYSELLQIAMDQAAINYADGDYIAERLNRVKAEQLIDLFTRFAPVLATEQREAWLSKITQSRKGKAFNNWHTVDQLLSSCSPLSSELSRIFIQQHSEPLAKRDNWGRQYSRAVAHHLAVECFPELEPRLRKLSDYSTIADLYSVYKFRYQMYKEFES